MIPSWVSHNTNCDIRITYSILKSRGHPISLTRESFSPTHTSNFPPKHTHTQSLSFSFSLSHTTNLSQYRNDTTAVGHQEVWQCSWGSGYQAKWSQGYSNNTIQHNKDAGCCCGRSEVSITHRSETYNTKVKRVCKSEIQISGKLAAAWLPFHKMNKKSTQQRKSSQYYKRSDKQCQLSLHYKRS